MPVLPGWLKGCGDQPEGAKKLGTEQWVMEEAIQERQIEGKLMGCWDNNVGKRHGSGDLSQKTDGFKDRFSA